MSDSHTISATDSAAGPRWRLVALMLMMVAAAHFNRISISVAGAEAIIPHKGISKTEMGLVYTAFLLFYTLAMSPGGLFIDRFGPRLSLCAVGGGAAVFVTLTGIAGYLWTGASLFLSLLVIRSLMGITNAPIHPGSARLVGDWIPDGQRSLVNGLTNFAALMGISATYLVFGALMDRYGWTGASIIVGGATLMLTLVWAYFARNFPPLLVAKASQGSTSQATVPQPAPVVDADTAVKPGPGPGGALGIQHATDPATLDEDETIPDITRGTRSGRNLLLNRSLIFLTLSYALLGYFQYLFFYWAQFYFEDVRRMSKEDGRLYATLLTLAMGLGMVAGGWLTDWTRTRFRHRRILALVPVIGLTLAAVFLILGLFTETPMMTLICFALAMASAGTSEGAFWTLAVEIGGTRGGLAAGILNTGGNAGGLIAPALTPIISELLGWKPALALAGVFCVLGAICWAWIDPGERVETKAEAGGE